MRIDKCITAMKAIATEIRENGASVTTDDIKKKIDYSIRFEALFRG